MVFVSSFFSISPREPVKNSSNTPIPSTMAPAAQSRTRTIFISLRLMPHILKHFLYSYSLYAEAYPRIKNRTTGSGQKRANISRSSFALRLSSIQAFVAAPS